MKKAALPRLFAADASIVVTLVLFDQVARMGQYADPQIAASAAVRPVADHIAMAGR